MSQRCAPGSSRLPRTVTGTAAAPSAPSAGAVLSPGLHPPPPGALAAAPDSPGQGSTCIRGNPWSGHPALPVLKDSLSENQWNTAHILASSEHSPGNRRWGSNAPVRHKCLYRRATNLPQPQAVLQVQRNVSPHGMLQSLGCFQGAGIGAGLPVLYRSL